MVIVPSHMRGLNRRNLFARLRKMGVASRADLAKSLGMSAPTAGKIVDELLDAGLLEEVEASEAARGESAGARSGDARLGRPGRLVRLDHSQRRFLGIELGVTETRFALLAVGINNTEEWTLRLPTQDSAEKWSGQLERAASMIPRDGFWGALVSVPGIVDEAAGRVLFSPNLHWSERADLRALVKRVWDVPVELVQEERALALGHQLSDPSGDDLLLVDFGEGVGGAIILGGSVYRSALPISGELGHTPVLGNDRPCGCGARGCVETLLSYRGLLQSSAESRRGGPHSWDAMAKRIADEGLPDWLRRALDAMGVIIAGAINVLGLKRIVITGVLTELPPSVVEYLALVVTRGAMWARFGKVVCESAPRRRAAGLVAVGIDRIVMPIRGKGRF